MTGKTTDFETARDVEAACIVGGAGTGKTQQLVGRIVRLLQEGATPESILTLCASPLAARAFRSRLLETADAVGIESANRICVTTPRERALELLGSESAVAWSGREPRILTSYEETFVMEDMKVSGLKPRRLREMMKFFFRSWTELADDDPGWLLEGEEENVHTMLKSILVFGRSYHESEVCNYAVNYLRIHEDTRGAASVDHVIADDFQRMSRASQLLSEMLANKTVAIAGDPVATVGVYDSYPYAKGLEEFAERHPKAEFVKLEECHRSANACNAASAVLADECMPDVRFVPAPDAPEGSLETIKCATPENEFPAVANTVENAIAAGTPAKRIAVAVPNDMWGRNAMKALISAGIPAERISEHQPVHGDVRDFKRCIPARILTALELFANPSNATAWRCWCGFGDYLTNSSAFSSLRSWAEERGAGLVEALDEVATGKLSFRPEGSAGNEYVKKAYDEGSSLVEGAQGLEGRALLEAIAHAVGGEKEEVPQVVCELCLEEGDDNSAEAMVNRARRRIISPTLETDSAVAVVPFDQAACLDIDMLIVAGFVNGFIPCHDYFDSSAMTLEKQKKTHARDCRRVYALSSAAANTTYTYFTSVGLEMAGQMSLKIERIYLKDGLRICRISPSEFLDVIRSGQPMIGDATMPDSD